MNELKNDGLIELTIDEINEINGGCNLTSQIILSNDVGVSSYDCGLTLITLGNGDYIEVW